MTNSVFVKPSSDKYGIGVKPTTGCNQLINHVSLVIDASSSMDVHAQKVRQLIKSEIENLAKESTSFSQETRISIYSFANFFDISCLVYDKDVLRLPDVANLYVSHGLTALNDALILSVSDMMDTPARYGDHSFLQIFITDGGENNSRNQQSDLANLIKNSGDRWTFLAFVPDSIGSTYMQNVGLSPYNCITWDALRADGFDQVTQQVQVATSNYFTSRSKGIRSSSNILALNTVGVTHSVVDRNLFKLTSGSYTMVDVAPSNKIMRSDGKVRIDDFMREAYGKFNIGKGFYQLTKTELVQGHKQICLVEKKTGIVYGGDKARDIIGLPGGDVKVVPDFNKDYDIFVQSTANNRNLISGTKLLVMR